MEESADINTLINTALCSKNQDYMNSEGMALFKKTLEDKSKKDAPALKLFLYFFPLNSSLEKNDKEFWFMKYKNVGNYNEYEFAKDILQCYNQYLSDKKSDEFDLNIQNKILLFQNYKLIGDFLSALKDYDAKIIATISYITKDSSFFAHDFDTKIKPEKIQKNSFILLIKDYLERKKLLFKLEKSLKMMNLYGDLLKQEKDSNENLIKSMDSLKKEVIELKINNVTLNENITKLQNDNVLLLNDNATLNKNITELKKDNVTLNVNINELQSDKITLNENISKMKNDISELKDRLDQIDTRDTVKMSLRYLYKILFSQFSNEMNSVKHVWDQIEEVKKILSKPQFKRLHYVSKFIDEINWTRLNNLNEQAHDSSQNTRNFKCIEKYFKGIPEAVTKFVAEFFEKLPNVNEFIKLNLLRYKDPKSIDDEFEKIKIYSDAYTDVFGNL